MFKINIEPKTLFGNLAILVTELFESSNLGLDNEEFIIIIQYSKSELDKSYLDIDGLDINQLI